MAETCTLIDLPEFRDARGALSFAQVGAQINFPIKRLFHIYDVAAGETRGAHAHRAQYQFVIMFAGACTVTVDTGHEKKDVCLSRPNQALSVPPMHWLTLADFTPGSVCGVLTSGEYDEADYIRDYAEFETLAKAGAASYA
jgi:hypothetical protein